MAKGVLIRQAARSDADVLIGELDGREVRFAPFFENFSTFVGRCGIHLEDVFVREEARGAGVGKRLLLEVAAIALRRGCDRLEWKGLDWNAAMIAFYKLLGAEILGEWKLTRMDGEAIAKLLAR